MKSVPVTAAIAAVARRQHGLITTAQLRELDVSRKQLETWTRNGRFERTLPGVLRLAGATATREQGFEAAVLWAGHGALASHRSAGELWGFDGVRGAKPEITLPAKTVKRAAGVVVHQTRAGVTQRRTRYGIPVTTPERTIIDLAGSMSAEQLEVAFESGRRERWVTVASVERALGKLGPRGRDGSAELRTMLATLADEPPAESPLEVVAARVLRESGLPKPERQVEIAAPGADYRLDFAWPRELVALECDGRKGHEPAFEQDRRRWSAIQASTGYRIVWATWRSIREQPEQTIAELRTMLARAA